MIKISKQQRDYLIENGIGHKVYLDDIHRTNNHHKKYYATTSPAVLDFLYRMEQEKIISTRIKSATV